MSAIIGPAIHAALRRGDAERRARTLGWMVASEPHSSPSSPTFEPELASGSSRVWRRRCTNEGTLGTAKATTPRRSRRLWYDRRLCFDAIRGIPATCRRWAGRCPVIMQWRNVCRPKLRPRDIPRKHACIFTSHAMRDAPRSGGIDQCRGHFHDLGASIRAGGLTVARGAGLDAPLPSPISEAVGRGTTLLCRNRLRPAEDDPSHR